MSWAIFERFTGFLLAIPLLADYLHHRHLEKVGVRAHAQSVQRARARFWQRGTYYRITFTTAEGATLTRRYGPAYRLDDEPWVTLVYDPRHPRTFCLVKDLPSNPRWLWLGAAAVVFFLIFPPSSIAAHT